MSILGKGTEFILRWFAFRLPIEDSFAMPVSVVDGFTNCTGKLTPAAFHSFRVIFIDRISCFHNHHIATEFFTDMLDVLDTVRYHLIFISPESAVKSPIRIKRHTYHIPLCPVVLEHPEVEIV